MPRARKPTTEDLPSTGYGDEAALMESLQAVPFVGPDEVPNLSDETARPEEPLTAGLPSGPGPGPEVLGPDGTSDPTRQVLQAMLVAFPNNDIMRLLDMLDLQGR
jgi:hypothetical protein